jgi:hypothetical protein
MRSSELKSQKRRNRSLELAVTQLMHNHSEAIEKAMRFASDAQAGQDWWSKSDT